MPRPMRALGLVSTWRRQQRACARSGHPREMAVPLNRSSIVTAVCLRGKRENRGSRCTAAKRASGTSAEPPPRIIAAAASRVSNLLCHASCVQLTALSGHAAPDNNSRDRVGTVNSALGSWLGCGSSGVQDQPSARLGPPNADAGGIYFSTRQKVSPGRSPPDKRATAHCTL